MVITFTNRTAPLAPPVIPSYASMFEHYAITISLNTVSHNAHYQQQFHWKHGRTPGYRRMGEWRLTGRTRLVWSQHGRVTERVARRQYHVTVKSPVSSTTARHGGTGIRQCRGSRLAINSTSARHNECRRVNGMAGRSSNGHRRMFGSRVWQNTVGNKNGKCRVNTNRMSSSPASTSSISNVANGNNVGINKQNRMSNC